MFIERTGLNGRSRSVIERHVEDIGPAGAGRSTSRGYKHPAPNGATFETKPCEGTSSGPVRAIQQPDTNDPSSTQRFHHGKSALCCRAGSLLVVSGETGDRVVVFNAPQRVLD